MRHFSHLIRGLFAATVLLVLSGCVAYPVGGYYGGPGYYAAPAVVVGPPAYYGGYGRHGGYGGHWRGRWR